MENQIESHGYHHPSNWRFDPMSSTIREVALKKEDHYYLFRSDAKNHPALLAVLRRFTQNPDLNFSWHDAAVVCQKIRQPSANRGRAVPTTTQNRLR